MPAGSNSGKQQQRCIRRPQRACTIVTICFSEVQIVDGNPLSLPHNDPSGIKVWQEKYNNATYDPSGVELYLSFAVAISYYQ